ncbi:MAG: TonB-dependent receptor [Parvularculaceae bacterium]|nr:TonB-dependent receptor [Parvularculaceae bacterium]
MFIFDLERVEVLRGPQNTLYGRNTTGGAVNFVTRKPEIGGETNGYLDVTAGNFGTRNFEAAVGGPIGENSAYRFAIQSINHDGYWDNLTTGDEQGERSQTMARAQFATEFTPEFTVRLDLHGGFSDGGQRGIKTHGLFADTGFGGAPCTDIDLDNLETSCVDGFGGATLEDNDVVTSDLRDDRDDINAWGSSLTADWDLGGPTLKYISAFEYNDYDHWEDADGLPVPFVNFRQKSDTEQWSQELRLSSDGSGAIRWIAGAFAFWESTKFSTAVPIALFDPAASFSDNNLVDHDTTMYSVYGKLDIDITDRLTLISGLRYAYEEKKGNAKYQFAVGLDALDINDADAFLFENLVDFRAPGSYINRDFGDDWDLWGGQLGFEYEAGDDSLIYAHVSRGQKAGQFTDAPDAIANGGFFQPADSETVWAYEAGFKASLLDNRLVTNVAVFYNDYDNQQQQVTLPGPVSTVVNVASSSTSGIEFDATYAPGGGWLATLAAGYLKTEVQEDSLGELTGGALTIREGRELTNSPEFSASASLEKAFEFSDGSSLTVGGDINYAGERNFDLLEIAVDPAFVTDDAYTIVNGVATYRFGPDQNYTASVFGKNLLNETYYTLMQEFDIGNAILFTGTPRTWGVSLGVDF